MNEKEYIKVNREAYNKFAPQHKSRHDNISKYDLTDEDWVELLSNKLLTSNSKNVLEIGPGTGRILRIFEEELNVRTTAVELASEMVEIAKEKSPNTLFIVDDILNVNFMSKQFDAIFMGALIHNFPLDDSELLLKKCYSWLRDDGKVLIYTTIHEKSEEGYFEKEDYSGKIVRFRKKFTEKKLYDLVSRVGFKVDYTMYTEELDRNKKWIVYICKKLSSTQS